MGSIYGDKRPSVASAESERESPAFSGSMSLEMAALRTSSSSSSSSSSDKASSGTVTRAILFQSHASDVIPEQLRVPASMRTARGEAATLNPLVGAVVAADPAPPRLDPKGL